MFDHEPARENQVPKLADAHLFGRSQRMARINNEREFALINSAP